MQEIFYKSDFFLFLSVFHFFISFRFLFIFFSLSFISSLCPWKYFKRYKFYQVINYCSLFFCIAYFIFHNERNWFFSFYQIISVFPLFLFLNRSLISSSLIHIVLYGYFCFHALKSDRLCELSTLTGKYLQLVLTVLVSIQSIIEIWVRV